MHGEKVAVVTKDKRPNSLKAKPKAKAKAAAALLINEEAEERTCAICKVEGVSKVMPEGHERECPTRDAHSEVFQ